MKRAPMSMERMKAVDHWVGLPVCACLGLLAKLSGLAGSRREIPADPRRILIMKFFGLGSVVHASPMLRAIRERYPHSKLTFLTFAGTAGLVEGMGLCDEVWQLRTDGMRTFVGDVLRQTMRFLSTPIDICIDLEFFSKFSTFMSVLSNAQVRVAFQLNSFWRYSLVTHPVYYNYYRHVSDVYADAAAAIGATVSDHRPQRIKVDAAALDRSRERLRDAGWNGSDRLVAVNINAGELSLERRWPGDRFAVVLERLAGTDGVQAVMTGSPDEAGYVASVVELLSSDAKRRIINLAGKLTFTEFIASLDLYDFMLTNDSGPVHLAWAQQLDTISLWGVGRPSFYGPRTGDHSTLYRQLPCSPCLYMFTSQVGQWCNHRADCMQAIGVDEVWQTVKAYIANPREARSAIRVAEGW